MQVTAHHRIGAYGHLLDWNDNGRHNLWKVVFPKNTGDD